jgi:hypothetical protein
MKEGHRTERKYASPVGTSRTNGKVFPGIYFPMTKRYHDYPLSLKGKMDRPVHTYLHAGFVCPCYPIVMK